MAKKEEKKEEKKHKEKEKDKGDDDDDARRLKEEAKRAKEARDSEAKKAKDDEKKARAKAKAAAENDAQFGESAEAELAALDAASLAAGDGSLADAAKAAYELFPSSVYAAYGKLQDYARDLNTSIAAKEIVFVGRVGDGKSALIDAIVGERFGSARATTRPIHFTLVQNDECTAPRITIKRDPTIPDYDQDASVSVAQLPGELDDRNREFTDVPVYVLYESATVLNVTLIDLPGIDDKNAKTEALALGYMKDTSRRIVVCEAAKDFANVTMLDIVKKADPDLSRTTFVFTKFHQYLRTFTDSRLLNRYLSQAFPEVPTYFVSLPSSRVPLDAPHDMRTRVYQALRRDMALLEQLQHDKRHEKSFGAHAVRRRLLHHVWRGYQDAVPRVLKQLRARAATTDRELRAQQAQLQALDVAKLRSIASHYVVAFLQAIARLLEGTCDANPAAAGETLADERREQGHDDWLDAQNRPIRFDPAEWKVPYADAKIYGGQQFERALAEFRAVMQHSRLGDVSVDEVASAAGVNRLNNVPNYGWAASDIAAHKTRDTFVPLIEQLTQRVVYIVKRLASLADSLIEAQRVRAGRRAQRRAGRPGRRRQRRWRRRRRRRRVRARALSVLHAPRQGLVFQVCRLGRRRVQGQVHRRVLLDAHALLAPERVRRAQAADRPRAGRRGAQGGARPRHRAVRGDAPAHCQQRAAQVLQLLPRAAPGRARHRPPGPHHHALGQVARAALSPHRDAGAPQPPREALRRAPAPARVAGREVPRRRLGVCSPDLERQRCRFEEGRR